MSKSLDLKIINAKIALLSGIVEGEIGVKEGKIVSISKEISEHSEVTIDAKNKLVLPGAVDVHAHIYDPRFKHREDFYYGTLAAAFGGVTTVIVMPLDTHIDNVEILNHYIEVGEKEAFIDFSIQGGFIKSENINNVSELAKRGIRAYKMFTCRPYMATDDVFIKMLKLTKKLGILVTVHAEDEAVLEDGISEAMKTGRKDSVIHHLSRSPTAEKVAMEKLLGYVEYTGGRLHLCHITTSYAVDVLKYAKTHGLDVTGEVCIHHLLFTYDDAKKWGPLLKMNPPLRSKEHVEALLKGLSNGLIDVVATDHAPGSREEKDVGWEDIWKAWGGVAGVETLLPVVFTYGFKKGILSLKRLIEILMYNPAKIFGLPMKGKIAVGADADLLIIDPEFKKKVKAEDLHYKNPWTPYEGMELYGWPTTVIIRGTPVILDRELQVEKGYGKFVKAITAYNKTI